MSELGFLQIFENLEDPRVDRTRKHPFMSIISLLLLGSLAGLDSFMGLHDFAEAHKDSLKDILYFPHGIPSHDTIGRVISMLDIASFHECFIDFTEQIKTKKGELVAIDGKTIRNSHETNPIHLVSAWSHENKLALGQVRVDDKSNEITAIPALLDLLDIEGQVVSIDAMGCQKKIAQKILDKGGDYVLSLKMNHKSFYDDAKKLFEDSEKLSKTSFWQEVDKGHGRIEKRHCLATSDITWLQEKYCWPGLKSIAMVKSERASKKKKSSDIRFYISSLNANAGKMSRTARMHWGIENKVHWALDVVFNEDKCAIRKDNAPEIMAMVRKWALNVHYKTKNEKTSMKRAMAKCAMSPKYLHTVLTGI